MFEFIRVKPPWEHFLFVFNSFRCWFRIFFTLPWNTNRGVDRNGTEITWKEWPIWYDMAHITCISPIWYVGPYSIGYPMCPKFFVVFSFKLYRIIRWFIDTVSNTSISVKDDAIRRERSSLAIRSLLLLIDLNKEITIISVDESEDVTKAISPIRNTSCSPVEFSSLSPQPDLIDPVHSAKAWLTRKIISPAVMQLLHY